MRYADFFMQIQTYSLPSKSGVRSLMLLSGMSGEGKTRFLLHWIEEQRQAGRKVGGVVSPGEWVDGIKTGICVQDAATGKSVPLAIWQADGWRFFDEGICFGADAIARAANAEVLVIDEIGPMELLAGKGWVHALDVLTSGEYQDAVVVVREKLVTEFKDRMQLK